MLRYVSLSILLAGCQIFAASNSCDLANWQMLIGEDQRILLTYALPPKTRVIAPGTAVTKDYRPDRLNIHLDGSNVITRLSCG